MECSPSINEAKTDIKKRLCNSPDRADAYVNGLYALQFVEGCLQTQKYGKRDSYSEDEFENSSYDKQCTAMGM